MTDAVAIQLITSTATVITIIVAALINRKTLTKQTETIRGGQIEIADEVKEVHTLADGRLTQALDAVDQLKVEIQRINAGGMPTPTTGEGVTQTAEGQVDTPKKKIHGE